MSWFADSMIARDPRSDEIGLIVRPIFSGSNPGVLTVQLASGSISLGNISGSFTQPQPASGSFMAVARTSSTVVIASGNLSRMGLTVYNDSNGQLYLKLGSGATTSAFTVKLVANAYYEVPFPVYTGVVTGVWATAGSGNAMVTELVP